MSKVESWETRRSSTATTPGLCPVLCCSLMSKTSFTINKSPWSDERSTGFTSNLDDVRASLTRHSQGVEVALGWAGDSGMCVADHPPDLDELLNHLQRRNDS